MIPQLMGGYFRSKIHNLDNNCANNKGVQFFFTFGNKNLGSQVWLSHSYPRKKPVN